MIKILMVLNLFLSTALLAIPPDDEKTSEMWRRISKKYSGETAEQLLEVKSFRAILDGHKYRKMNPELDLYERVMREAEDEFGLKSKARAQAPSLKRVLEQNEKIRRTIQDILRRGKEKEFVEELRKSNQYDEFKDIGRNISDYGLKMEILEQKLDSASTGHYVQEKMEKLLASEEFCHHAQQCASGEKGPTRSLDGLFNRKKSDKQPGRSKVDEPKPDRNLTHDSK